MILSGRQQQAADTALAGQNTQILGSAGMGKSVVINHITKQRSGYLIMAPTGTSALNIGGVTAHRIFRFPLGIVEPSVAYGRKISDTLTEAKADLRGIVLDEIGAFRADFIAAMDVTLKRLYGNELFMGGIQVIVAGDYYQTAPVVIGEEALYFHDAYGGPYAFNTKCWPTADFQTIELDVNHRFKGDDEFRDALEHIKYGMTDTLPYFNQRVVSSQEIDNLSPRLILTPTNGAAKAVNNAEISRIPGLANVFHAKESGEVTPDDRFAPTKIRLKIGCRIMTVINDEEGAFVNGSMGTVISICPKKTHVSVLMDGEDLAIDIAPHKRNIEELDIQAQISGMPQPIIGVYEQLPLILAWAVTIHKSQGKTLDNVVLDLGSSGAFSTGLLFVGLSRVRGLKNLYLRTPIKSTDVKASHLVIRHFHPELYP